MTKSEWLAAAFEKCGPDPDCGLAALGALDQDGSLVGDYLAKAAARCYKQDYAAWFRKQEVTVAHDLASERSGAVRLFELPEAQARRLIRERVVLTEAGERHEYAVLGLSGAEGARVLRAVAERDLKPARTSVARCRFQLKLASALEAESERLGRDVGVSELLGVKAAA